MSGSDKGSEIGYGRPPKATQWKKGQSGNPGGRSSPRSISIVEMIDRLLLALVEITISGEPKQVTALEAILERLWSKGIAGDHRAMAVYIRCRELAPQVAEGKVKITFADSDYTRTLAVLPRAARLGDER